MTVFMTPAAVAARWNCSAGHVRALCRSGRLRAMRLGSSDWRVRDTDVAAYEEAQMTEPAPEVEPEVTRPAPKTEPATVAVGGLPEGYSPVFGDLWK